MNPKDPHHPQSANGRDRHVLQPVFGTHCVTESFYTKTGGRRPHTHMEAVMTCPRAKTWAVNKIVREKQDSGETVTRVTRIHASLSFRDAAAVLSDFETDCRARADVFGAIYPDAETMAYLHYKAFAEREGYVFDINGMPHARPAAGVLPPGDFSEAAIRDADRHVKRPPNEYDGHGPLSRVPATHFLFDTFNRAAHGDSMQARLTEMRVVSLLDTFHANIASAHEKMETYCANYPQTGYGKDMVEAREKLHAADISLIQLDAYGIDTTAFKSFTLQCRITSFILHAEGLYDLMNKGRGDFNENEAAFNYCVAQALDGLKKIDPSAEAAETLQNMVVQSVKPEVPAAIGLFVTNYRTQRQAYDTKRTPPPALKP
jgi:hypothetical protein